MIKYKIRPPALQPHIIRRCHETCRRSAVFLAFSRSAAAEELHSFGRVQPNDQFRSERASFGDLNNDGVNDIISGPKPQPAVGR